MRLASARLPGPRCQRVRGRVAAGAGRTRHRRSPMQATASGRSRPHRVQCTVMGSEYGRIDADGTVYVKTADGEREIGSWQAGDTAAGLAFYRRRYEDLATEVGLLEKRLESGAGDPQSTRTHAEAMKEQLSSAAAIGDLTSLAVRLDALLAAAE